MASRKSKQKDRPGSGRRESARGEATNRLDDWIGIEPDGTITAFSGKVELGTGVRTALAQIVAEELDVPLARVHMVMGDTALTPDEGYTAGSMTIQSSGTALRQAAAEARRALLEMASEQLDANKEEVQFDELRITSVDWPTYPILKFSELPEVEIVLVNHPEKPALGVGEPSTVTTAAAVANAIFDAIVLRLRQIPFTPERVQASLLERQQK